MGGTCGYDRILGQKVDKGTYFPRVLGTSLLLGMSDSFTKSKIGIPPTFGNKDGKRIYT